MPTFSGESCSKRSKLGSFSKQTPSALSTISCNETSPTIPSWWASTSQGPRPSKLDRSLPTPRSSSRWWLSSRRNSLSFSSATAWQQSRSCSGSHLETTGSRYSTTTSSREPMMSRTNPYLSTFRTLRLKRLRPRRRRKLKKRRKRRRCSCGPRKWTRFSSPTFLSLRTLRNELASSSFPLSFPAQFPPDKPLSEQRSSS